MQQPAGNIKSPAPGDLRIGEWWVAPDLNRIGRGREVVHLEPKAMAVLLYLAQQPGKVAGREELLAAIWPGVVVGDNALTQVVIKLRRALGDTAREPAYIQAIAKKGYRLIAAVDRSTGDAPGGPSGLGAGAAPRRRHAALWIGVPLAVGALSAAATWFLLKEAPSDARAVADPVRAAAGSSSELPTVVIKPLEVIGDDAHEKLIARAISTDLVTDLSKVSGMRVGFASDPSNTEAEGGARARARYVLTGTLQSEGRRLRLHVGLADVVAGRQLWSQRFDRDADDLFAVQDDLVRHVLAELPVKVTEAETQRLARRYTRNLQAYEHFLKGQAALLVRRRAQNETARDLYWKAIQADPAFARAYAGLAMTYALEYQQGWAAAGGSSLNRALELADAAVQMSPDMPEGHWVVAFVRTQERRHAEALQSIDSALRLNPSYADAYALKAGICTYMGRPAESIPLLHTALRLNPDAGSLYFLLLGRAFYFLGDLEQAKVNLEHALLRNAENLEARVYLAAANRRAGDASAAEWQASEIRALEPSFKAGSWLASYPMTDVAQKQRLVESLAEMGF